jgi:hypothetical protein
MDLATVGQGDRQGAVCPFSVCADASVVKEVASGTTVNNGCIVRSVNGGRDGIGTELKMLSLSLVQLLAKAILVSVAGPMGHSFSLPPSLFSFVASLRCPAIGHWQFALVCSLPQRKPWDQQ